MSRALVLLTLLLTAVPLLAQDAEDANAFGETLSVQYVMVPFTALGQQGDPITNLSSRDVALLVDGVQVKSDLFEKSLDAPVSYTILIDGSGSMQLAGKMQAARAAVETLLGHRRPGDDFSLYLFTADEAHELVPFTSDPTPIRWAMTQIKPYGKTAFFDALATMPERSRLGRNPTRAIILLSDGIDNASRLTRHQLASRLEGISIPIYPLGLREPQESELDGITAGKPSETSADLAILSEVAELTGGQAFIGNQPHQLAQAVEKMERNLRAQYLIGFSPTGKGAVKYRRISLRVAGRVGSVNVRAGYRGTEPPTPASARGKSKRTEKKGS